MKRTVSIVGGGASALMLAAEIDTTRFDVTIYERNAALARKFLVAGDGGFNLTHSEGPRDFIARYTAGSFIKKAFNHFSNKDFIAWLNNIGIETYVGSSGRVFPKRGIKPVQVLDAFLAKIGRNNVVIKYRHLWKGFKDDQLVFENDKDLVTVKSDIVVFCLGGASWPVTGSKGEWLEYFKEKDVRTKPFVASNCASKVNWDTSFINKFEGKALKNIVVSCGSKEHAGEIVLTRFGMEGSGIYPLSPQIREQLSLHGKAKVVIDLKPSYTMNTILEKLQHSKENQSDILKNEIGLNSLQVQLIKSRTSKEVFLDPQKLSFQVKNFELDVCGMGPLEDAISTVGGIDLSEIDLNFELEKMPGHYAIGEMLDYDAPTGGYLLQSCMSMGKYVADYLNSKA